MATPKQIEANRRNALKSTGPKSEQGKIAACRNATRHGLYSNRVVLHYEHEQHFLELRDNLLRDWKPANAQETLLVEQIAQAAWRLQRAIRVETGTLDLYSRELCHRAGVGEDNPHGDEGLAIIFTRNEFDLDRLRRYMTAVQRSYQGLINQLVKLQENRPKDGRTVDPPPVAMKADVQEKVVTAAAGATVIEMASFRQITPKPNAAPPSADRSRPGSVFRLAS